VNWVVPPWRSSRGARGGGGGQLFFSFCFFLCYALWGGGFTWEGVFSPLVSWGGGGGGGGGTNSLLSLSSPKGAEDLSVELFCFLLALSLTRGGVLYEPTSLLGRLLAQEKLIMNSPQLRSRARRI